MVSMRVRKLEVSATHEPFLSRSSRRKEAHSIVARSSGKRSEPRYLGCYVRFKFKAPIRVHKQMPATHEPDPHPALRPPSPIRPWLRRRLRRGEWERGWG